MAEVCHTGDMFSGKAWVGSIRTGDFGRRLCYSDGKGLQGTAAVCSGFLYKKKTPRLTRGSVNATHLTKNPPCLRIIMRSANCIKVKKED